MPGSKTGDEMSLRSKAVMRFRIIGSLNLTRLALIAMIGRLSFAQSCEIQIPLMQFQSGPGTRDTLMVQPWFGEVPILELKGPSAFGIHRALAETPAAPKNESRTDSNYQLRKVEEWRAAAVQHNPGKPDSAAVMIGSCDARDLELVIKFVTKLAS